MPGEPKRGTKRTTSTIETLAAMSLGVDDARGPFHGGDMGRSVPVTQVTGYRAHVDRP